MLLVQKEGNVNRQSYADRWADNLTRAWLAVKLYSTFIQHTVFTQLTDFKLTHISM